ncbi:MAG TPA: DUF222 domain-containing protein [Jiangellaceae bacterium]|nr:DUF222 domain-containing protein [Jiangellaceae bacterium]
MFESRKTGGSEVDYGFVEPLAPGAVDPVRLAALVEGLDAGYELLDPAEFALFGPEPGVDPVDLFEGLVTPPPTGMPGSDGPVEPAVSVPSTVPGLDDMPPGPALAEVLDAADLSALGAYEVVESVAGWQRIASWAAAGQAKAIAELARRVEMRPVEGGREIESMSRQRVTAMEVAARLRLTPAAGEALVSRSMCLVQTLPATYAALAEGRIDIRRAEVISDELRRHEPEVARLVEAEVCGRAEQLTVPRLRQALRRALHRCVPSTMEQRSQEAASRREVRFTPTADGMAWLEAYLPAEDAAAVEAAVEAAAAAMKRQTPATGAARHNGAPMRWPRWAGSRCPPAGWVAAPAARGSGWTAGTAARGGAGHRRGQHPARPRPASGGAGRLRAGAGLGALAGSPPRAPGGGCSPIQPPVRCSTTAAPDTSRRRSSSTMSSPATGRVAGRPATAQRGPASSTTRCATRSEPPRPGISGAFCKAHHIGKHNSRWRVRQPAPGRFEWVSPTGHVYTVEPEPVGPVGLPSPADREPPGRVGLPLAEAEPPPF